MKNLLILLILFPLICQAQKCPAPRQQLREPLYNSISVCLQSNDLGIGLRYDRIIGTLGAYVSASHGRYEFIQESTKFAIGGTWIEKNVFISAGATSHINRGISEVIDRRALAKFGGEIGAGVLFKRFVVSFAYELRLSNSSINFGYRF
jgi:hypothetical protein